MYIGPAELGQQGVVCLFVSRVRLMECLLPDGRVCICSVPHGRDLPLQTPLQGLGLGGETLSSEGLNILCLKGI